MGEREWTDDLELGDADYLALLNENRRLTAENERLREEIEMLREILGLKPTPEGRDG